jgi:PAS domain S-box-containing protein
MATATASIRKEQTFMTAPTRIGVVMAALGGYFWGGMLTGIQQVARQYGCQVLVFHGVPRDITASWIAWDVIDGWIVVHYDDDLDTLARAGKPLVPIDIAAPELGCPTVMADNYGGMLAAVRHLLEHGHTRIAFIGYLDNPSVWQRYEAYQAALAERGLPLDPQLVVAVDDNLEPDGRMGAQRLIERGMPCTAIVVATDRSALGALEVVQAAGYQVPEDLAMVGFDDINLTQFTRPPLTTVRTRFDELGRIAAELLLAWLAGTTVPAAPVYVPTRLVLRRSCGCDAAVDLTADITFPATTAQDWGDALASRLVRLALLPVAPGPDIPPAQIWPGVVVLVDGLDAAITGASPPSVVDLGNALREIVALTPDLDTLSAMPKLLARAGADRLEAMSADSAAFRRLDAFIDRVQREIIRERIAQESAQATHLEELTQHNYSISMTLLMAEPGQVQQLAWLRQTTVNWGCLALHTDTPDALVVVGTYSRHGFPAPALGSPYAATAFPPPECFPPLAQVGEPDTLMLMPVETADHKWGVLALRAPIENQLTSDRPNMGMWGALLGAALDRKSLLAKLADQQATLQYAYEQRLIAENIRDLIGMLDQQGRYLYASPSYQHVLGYSPATLLGATMLDFVHPDDRASARELWARAAEGETIQATLRARHADGSWRWLEIAGAVIVRQGAPSVVMVSRDVTERRRLEAELLQSQKMETVGRLAGGVAHDFNNLLTAIIGYADMALAAIAPGNTVREDLDAILQAAQRAASLTRQLLAFARKQVIEARVINLNDLILELNNLLRRLIGEDIELAVQLTPDLWPVRVDPSQIEQVLVNLAVNARDAMPNGGTLTIETTNVELERFDAQHVDVISGPYVLLSVSDTGVGIDPRVREHIFEPFFTTKGPGRGTGLGLATCYGIITQHGGYIWPYSEAGQGTTFKIYLPRAQSAVTVNQSSRDVAGLPRGNEVILLAEDEDAVRTLTARMLRNLGYAVLEAANGEMALRLAQAYSGPIDLLLTDVVMPRMGGPQLHAQLAGVRPAIRVLYMSGYTDNTLINQGRLTEGVDLLSKPFAPPTLARKVRDALDS